MPGAAEPEPKLTGAGIDQAEIRRHLEAILASAPFKLSERLCRFLGWIVERTLNGETDQVSQYSLGSEVFDRGDNFDPRLDSIVRTEAQRLRRKLKEYYEKCEPGAAIRIVMPPGTYIAAFQRNSPLTEPDAAQDVSPDTVAVLPFANLGPDADQDYLCDGIAESILDELASSPGLRVVARTSAFRFRQLDADLRDIGRQLNAGTLIEGSVRRSGDRLRVSAKAVDTATGNYVWAEVFHRSLDDVFGIEDEIARAVADRLTVNATVATVSRRPAPPSVEAYTLFLRGRHFWNQLTWEGHARAVDEYRRAISRFPSYAQPYAGLADAYNWLMYFGAGPPADLLELSEEASRTALRLDPSNGEATVALGSVTGAFRWQWDEAEALIRRGLELQPSYVAGHLQNAFHYFLRGRPSDARLSLNTALRLDPLSVRTHRNMGVYYFLTRDYTSALVSLQRALELAPQVLHTYLALGRVYQSMGRFDEAIAAFDRIQVAQQPGFNQGWIAETHALAGRTDQALQNILPANPVHIASIHLALRAWDQALEYLERAFENQWICTEWLLLDPRYDAVRTHPRFQAILRRMNLLTVS